MIIDLLNKLAYLILWLISLINLSLLYPLSYLISLIINYRKEIILNNISNAFNKKTDFQINNISKGFYFYFTRILFEVIKMISSKKSFYKKRVKITNPEILENYFNDNQSVILLMGHHNNWEWAGQKIAISCNQDFISVYKKLSNRFFNTLMKKIRSKFGAIPIEINDLIKYIYNDNEIKVIGLIADQNPSVNSTTYWSSFFNRQVPVIDGPEKIARKMNYPVLFCNMSKIKNGYYSITFELIEEKPKNTDLGYITNNFIKRLEDKIIEEPNSYLWSHNRWKHKK